MHGTTNTVLGCQKIIPDSHAKGGTEKRPDYPGMRRRSYDPEIADCCQDAETARTVSVNTLRFNHFNVRAFSLPGIG